MKCTQMGGNLCCNCFAIFLSVVLLIWKKDQRKIWEVQVVGEEIFVVNVVDFREKVARNKLP